MANQFAISSLVTEECVAIFESSNTFIPTAYQKYEDMFTARTFAPGNTINVRLDNFFIGQRGDSISPEEIVEATIPLTIGPLYSVGILYTPTDLQRNFVDFSKELLEPATRRIAAMMNGDIAMNVLTQCNYWQGDTSAPINSYKSLDAIRPFMKKLGMPGDYKKYAAISPDDAHELRSNATIQNSFVAPLNKDVTMESRMGRLAGFDVMEEEQIINYLGGTKALQAPATAFQLVSFTSTTLTLKNAVVGQQTFKQGDLIYFEDRYSFNQVTRQSTGRGMSFTVVETPAVTDGAGEVTVSIFPNIITSGPRQNISSVPAVNDNLQAVDDRTANVAYTERGLVCAIPPLQRMDSPDSFVFTSPKTGISMRISKTAIVLDNKNVLRLDAQLATTWVPQQNIQKVSLVNQTG